MSRRGARITEEIKDEMVSLHLEQEWNLSEIGDRFGCSREMVRLVLKERGAPSLTKQRQKQRREARRVFNAVATIAYYESRKAQHGTRTMYQYGCSCDDCRAANREYQSRLRGRTPPHHGNSGYINYGCRCEICKEANSLAQQAFRRLRALRGEVAT